MAGVLTREDYLSAVKAAGFRNIKVLTAKSFPGELLQEESLAFKLSRKLGLQPEKWTDSLSAVVSISLRAEKP